MKSLVFSPQARIDLLEIQRFIASDKPLAAARFVDRLENECQLLARFPEIGEKQELLAPALRRFTCRGYGIYYLDLDDRVRIVRVLHSARDLRNITFD
jgi:toxin ParE1/3/4